MTAKAFGRRLAAVGAGLAAWSVLSLGVGAALLALGGPFGRAVGIQCLAWGGIDLLIAAFGERDRRRKAETLARDADAAERERRRVRRLLLVNSGLDVAYVAVGLALVAWGDPGPARAGHGLGVLVQGGFLLAFDLAHAARLAPSVSGSPGA